MSLRPGQRLRVPGHKLTLVWSGETGIESSSTAECSCGWAEAASNQHECRFEYRQHLLKVIGMERAQEAGQAPDSPEYWDTIRKVKDEWYGR